MADATISEDDFQKFREFFYRKTGIQFDMSKRYFVDKRLLERMADTGNATFRSYFTMLRFQASGAELQTLTNSMTVNETYFFREEYQFKCLVNSLLPDLVSAKRTMARCASGCCLRPVARSPIRLRYTCWSVGPASTSTTWRSWPLTLTRASSIRRARACIHPLRGAAAH